MKKEGKKRWQDGKSGVAQFIREKNQATWERGSIGDLKQLGNWKRGDSNGAVQ